MVSILIYHIGTTSMLGTNPPEPIHWAPLLLPGFVSAVFGLVGVIVGGWITNRNQAIERRNRRYTEQLRFYAELLSIRKVIRAKSLLREEFRGFAHKAKDEIGDDEFERFIKYSDDELRDELIPLYRKMLDHLVANMALAEPSTQQHFDKLVQYVEEWNRFLKGSLPAAIARQISTDQEKKLYPLYEDLQQQVDRLRQELVK